MKTWKFPLLVASVVTAGGLGAAFAPVAHGQTARVAPRAVEMLGGQGPEIGVSIRDLDQDTARAGVAIDAVAGGSPAEKAGIKKDDVVVEFDGERVRSVRQFARLVRESPAGRKTPVIVMRDGQRVSLTVEPRASNNFNIFRDEGNFGGNFRYAFPVPPAPPAPPAAPAAPRAPAPPAPPAPPAFPDLQTFIWRSSNTLGITVSELSSQLAEHFGAKNGVLVTSVADASSGAKAGVKAGDVITSVNGSEVGDPSDLRRRIQRTQEGSEFTIGVVRDKKPMILTGKLDPPRSGRTSRSSV
ncbi:MAG: PDZ domain-containing protein [Acidobacteriota bacterium]